MNKGRRGRKARVERQHPRTSRADFDRQERAIERTERQKARREIAAAQVDIGEAVSK